MYWRWPDAACEKWSLAPDGLPGDYRGTLSRPLDDTSDYTHLSALVTEQAESSKTRKHVVAGERIATSGIGNGVPHLHLGLLLDDQVEQDDWTFILREDAIRKVIGGYKNGELLPSRCTGTPCASSSTARS